jgi:hypothetical protein
MNIEYGLGSRLLTIAGGFGGFFLRAYVLLVLWRWFAVPLGLPAVGMMHAYGLALLVQFATYNPPIKDRDVADGAAEERDATRKERMIYVGAHIVKDIIAPLFVWGLGYVAHGLM